jgi:putative hydrolase of the HAD superfamily
MALSDPTPRAVIFDVHGTLLSGGGPMRYHPEADLRILERLRRNGHCVEGSPTRSLEEAVARHHQQANHAFPEIDLRTLWADLLGVEAVGTEWLTDLEDARQPLRLMPSAREAIADLSSRHFPLGLLSNAQADTLPVLCRELGGNPFEDDLCVLSYQHGIAKPAARLFEILVAQLAMRDIPPSAAVLVGNDPLHDIAPAKAIGMRTVLLTAEPDFPADQADAVITDLSQLGSLLA